MSVMAAENSATTYPGKQTRKTKKPLYHIGFKKRVRP